MSWALREYFRHQILRSMIGFPSASEDEDREKEEEDGEGGEK